MTAKAGFYGKEDSGGEGPKATSRDGTRYVTYHVAQGSFPRPGPPEEVACCRHKGIRPKRAQRDLSGAAFTFLTLGGPALYMEKVSTTGRTDGELPCEEGYPRVPLAGSCRYSVAPQRRTLCRIHGRAPTLISRPYSLAQGRTMSPSGLRSTDCFGG